MVQHTVGDDEWWCLPGGRIEDGETPEKAALRELREECNLAGRIVRKTAETHYDEDSHHTFWIEIDDQRPRLGEDPENLDGDSVLTGFAWHSLAEVSEKDRAYLWTAGLLTIPEFAAEIEDWTRETSYPETTTEPGAEGNSG